MKKLINRYRNNKFMINFAKVISVDFLAKTANILLLPVYLSLMTQNSFGLYSYFLNIINTFALVLSFGLAVPQSKFYHDYKSEEDRGSLFLTLNVLLAGGLLIVLGVVFISGWDYDLINLLFKNHVDYPSYRLYILIAIIAVVYSNMLTNFFLTTQRISNLQKYNVTRIIAINVITLAMLKFLSQDTALTRLQFFFMSELILAVLFGISYFRMMRGRFRADIAIKIIVLAFPIMLSAILGIFINFADKFVLEKFGGFKDLAIYNLGFTLAGIVQILFMTFQNVWLPHFFSEKDIHKNIQRTGKVIVRVGLVLLALGVLLFLGILLVVKLSIIDKVYSPVISLFPILMFSQLFSALTTLYSNYLILFEKTYFVVLVGVPMAILNVLGNFLLIPVLGYYGAATATMIVNLCYLVSYYCIVNFYLIKKIPTSESTV